jgi:G3E family GTPase
MQNLIPATILTGFLGAGKSTLLRRVLGEPHGRRIAVIENEFGEESIDGEILVGSGAERIVQLSNGCLCCGIRDDLRATLVALAQARARGELAFDQVMIETTGLADPGPIAQTFFLDPEVCAAYRPDAVLTLVDAANAMRQLDTRGEARRQVGFADRLFLSKSDLVQEVELDRLGARLARMNPRALQLRVRFGQVPLDQVFDQGGFNLDPTLELQPTRGESHGHDEHGHDSCDEACAHHHHFDDDVHSFVFRSARPFHQGRFATFMNAVVKSHGPDLLRYKGILHMAGQDRKVILQGVHQLMSHDLGPAWEDAVSRETRLVFIGLGLPERTLMRSLQMCLA